MAVATLFAILVAPAADAATITFEGDDQGLLYIGHDIHLSRESGEIDGTTIVLRARHLVVAPGVTVYAGDGADAPDVAGRGRVVAPAGGAGGDIIVQADRVDVAGTLAAGNGGRGGDAYASGLGPVAVGGDGGQAGRVIGLRSSMGRDGNGGSGGRARAEATGGECLPPTEASVRGRDGLAPGEDGNSANANGLNATDSCGPDRPGRAGGSASAFGGNGSGTGAMPGSGGDAIAIAGHGGGGWQGCVTHTSGTDGGPGGNAYAFGGNISGGAYAVPSGKHAGNATAIGGNGGPAGAGTPAGDRGPRGLGYAVGGSAGAVGAFGGVAGGSARNRDGDSGRGADECSSPMLRTPGFEGFEFTLTLAFAALVRRSSS